MLVIQFKPYGAYPFFHFPIQELNEKVVHAQLLFENEILELREEILIKKTSEEKFKSVEKWLNDKFHQDKTPSSELLSILEKLQSESVVNYRKIIEDYSKTQKHALHLN
ncbi:MAG: hypothetical protein ACJA08_000638 [Cyclobacteriaceae bacterium]|jgi:hypothetical protein